MKPLNDLLDKKIHKGAIREDACAFSPQQNLLIKEAYKAGVNSVKPLILELVEGIKNHLKNNDCDCGYEQPMGEGYTDGICFLHEALQKLRKELGDE